jgi:hypothetical protein
MAEEQDKSYRLLFSVPRMVSDLIRLAFSGPWVRRLDFSSLEKVSERDVSPELIRREKDVLWRLRLRPRGRARSPGTWIYVHLEFQSELEPFMALRALTYKSLLWEDLIRRQALTDSGKLPPVLSIVLYNGDRPWTGATSVVDLIEPLDDGLAASDLPSYLLIEERSFPVADLTAEASPVVGLFRMERCKNVEELLHEARKTVIGLEGSESLQLREAIGTWVARIGLRRLAPNEEFPWTMDLKEVQSMLEQRVVEWTEQWKQEGFREGESRLLLRQLEHKFGDLPAWARDKVEAADAEQLLDLGRRVLTAPSLEAVFED